VETTAANSAPVFDEKDVLRIGSSCVAQIAGGKLGIRADNASRRQVRKGEGILPPDLCVKKLAGLCWEREWRDGERSSPMQKLA
jgi:hypothetical protein